MNAPSLEDRVTALEIRIQEIESRFRQEMDFYRGIQIGDEESLRYLWSQFLNLRKEERGQLPPEES